MIVIKNSTLKKISQEGGQERGVVVDMYTVKGIDGNRREERRVKLEEEGRQKGEGFQQNEEWADGKESKAKQNRLYLTLNCTLLGFVFGVGLNLPLFLLSTDIFQHHGATTRMTYFVLIKISRQILDGSLLNLETLVYTCKDKDIPISLNYLPLLAHCFSFTACKLCSHHPCFQ